MGGGGVPGGWKYREIVGFGGGCHHIAIGPDDKIYNHDDYQVTGSGIPDTMCSLYTMYVILNKGATPGLLPSSNLGTHHERNARIKSNLMLMCRFFKTEFEKRSNISSINRLLFSSLWPTSGSADEWRKAFIDRCDNILNS